MAQRVRVLATLVEYQGSELSGASAPGPPGTTSRLCRHCLCTRCASLSLSRHRCSCVLLVENKAITLFFLTVVCQWHSWELLPSYSTHYLLSRAFEDNNKARTASLQLTSSQLGLCIPHPCSWSCEQRLCAWQWEEQLALCDVIQTREVAWKTDRVDGSGRNWWWHSLIIKSLLLWTVKEDSFLYFWLEFLCYCVFSYFFLM